MPTKRASARKGSTKKKSAARKSTKKSAKKSSKKLTKTASLTASPVTGDVDITFPGSPVLRCIEVCADAYGRCLSGGGNPQKCMKTFMSCLQGCLRRGGVGVIGGGGIRGGGGGVIDE